MSKKYPRNSVCPCGSGKKYKNCCINSKEFDWIIEGGEIKKRIKCDDIIFEELKKQHQRFIDVYGRESGKDDPIFFEQYLMSDGEHEKVMIDILTEINVNPAIIYAYRKTQRLVTEQNIRKLTDLDIKEWQDAIDEYYHLIENSNNEENKSLKNLSEYIMEIEQKLEKVLLIFSLIIFRYGEIDFNVDNIRQELKIEDYILFCITKTFKTLKSIINLIDRELIEDSLILLRTIYESYLDIVFILHNPQKLKDLIAQAGLMMGTHEYALNKKGKQNRRIIKDKVSGDEFDGTISTYQKVLSSDFQVDIYIHNFMYEYLSSFTHPSIFTIENYFIDNKFNPSKTNDPYEVVILCVFISVILLDELQYIDSFDEVIKQDIKKFIIEIKPLLINLLNELINTHSPGALIPLLLERVHKINSR